MGRHIWHETLAAEVLELAESISGLPLRSVMNNGPESSLRSPEYLEPSIVALQAANVLLLQNKGMQPDTVAGYSLGEIGALYTAGSFSLVDALTLASKRGQILARHAQKGLWSTRAVSFAEAPLALPFDGTSHVFITAYNSPREFSVTGESTHIQDVEALLLKRHATLSPVAVEGPWHSPFAAKCAKETAELLPAFEIRPPRVPVCLATTGVFQTDPVAIRSSLSRQIESPVRWTDTLETLWTAGVRATLEIGPSRVLTSFLRANWNQRPYHSQFLDRQGGRATDFAALKIMHTSALQTLVDKEKSWTKSA
jgi:[acyl-carrier-protein] S-malonyltransferase